MTNNMQRALYKLVNQLRSTSTFFKNALTNYQQELKDILDSNKNNNITIDIKKSNTNGVLTSTPASYNFKEINTNGKYPICVYDPLFTIMLCIVFYSKDLVGDRSPNYTFYLKNKQNQTQNVEPVTVAEQWEMFAKQYNNELDKQKIITQGSYENQTILTNQFRKICLTFLSFFVFEKNNNNPHQIFNTEDAIFTKGVHCPSQRSITTQDLALTTETNVEEFYKIVCQLFGVGCLVFSNCQLQIIKLNNIHQKFTFGVRFQSVESLKFIKPNSFSMTGRVKDKIQQLQHTAKDKTSRVFGDRELRLILAIKLPQPIPEPNQSLPLYLSQQTRSILNQQPNSSSQTLHPISSPTFEQPSIQQQTQPNISQLSLTKHPSPTSQKEFIQPISNIQNKNLRNVFGAPNPISKQFSHGKTNEPYVKSVSDSESESESDNQNTELPDIFNLASSKTVQQNQPQNKQKQSFVLSKPVSSSEGDEPCKEQIKEALTSMRSFCDKKLQLKNDEINKLSQQLNQCKTKSEQQNADFKKLISASKELRDRAKKQRHFKILYTNQMSALNNINNKLQACEATKNTLQTQLKEAQDKITSCENIQSKNKDLINEIANLQTQLKNKSIPNPANQKTINDLKSNIEAHETTIQKLQNEIKTLNTTNTNLKNKHLKLEEIVKTSDKIIKHSTILNENLKHKLNFLQSKHEQSLDELNEELGNANVLKKGQEDYIIKLQKRIQDQKKTFTKRRNKIQSTFGRRIGNLTNNIKDLETKKTKLEQTEHELRDQINVLNEKIKTYTSDDSKKDKTRLLNLQNQLNEAQDTLKTTIETHKKTEKDLLQQKFDFENKVKSEYKTELEQELAKIANEVKTEEQIRKEQEEAAEQRRKQLRKKRQIQAKQELNEANEAFLQAQEAHEKVKSNLNEYEIQAQKKHDLQQKQLETETSALHEAQTSLETETQAARASQKQVISLQKYEACNRSYKNIDEINQTIEALNHDLKNSINKFEISPKNPTLNSFSILTNICCAAVQAQDFRLDKIQVPEQMFENLLQAKSLIGMDWCMGLRGLVLSNDFGGLVCNVDNLAPYITKVIENGGGFKGVYPGMTMFNATSNTLQTILKSTQQPAYQLPQKGFFKEKIKTLFDVHNCCLKCILYDMLPIFPNLTLEHLLEYGLPINELPFSYMVLTAIYIEKRRIIITDELYNCVWVYADKPPPGLTKFIYININEEGLRDQPILMTRTKSESTSLGYKIN